MPRPRLGVGAPCAQHNVRVIWDATRWRSILRGLPAFPKAPKAAHKEKGPPDGDPLCECGYALCKSGLILMRQVGCARPRSRPGARLTGAWTSAGGALFVFRLSCQFGQARVGQLALPRPARFASGRNGGPRALPFISPPALPLYAACVQRRGLSAPRRRGWFTLCVLSPVL